MAENVVEIIVKSKNAAKPGFDSTAASAEEMSAKVATAMDEYTAATDRAAQAQAHLDAVMTGEGGASADELAAAQDRVTQATLASLDAQIKLGEAELEQSAKAREAATVTGESAAKTDAAGASAAGFGRKLSMVGLGLGIASIASIKMAGDFQASMTKLVTSAGESASNLKSDMAGVLQISVQTATGTKELASGLYMINSAGFHGAEGLKILKAAAQGARAEGASLADVSNAVTSALNAYGLKGRDATAVTDMLVATVGQGKMTMQDLASSIHAVLPVAAAAHISLDQVGGAIATMTSQGMSAQQATQDLSNTIRSLQNPNAVAVKEMGQLGLSSNDVADKIGKRGLTGTIDLLSQTVLKNMGPSGDVLLKTFNQSKASAQDAVTMMHALPPAIQGVAKGFLDGTITQKEWTSALKNMSPIARAQASEFATTAKNAHGFNAALRAGLPGTQTFEAALSKMMGGATGLSTALMVGGAHMGTFKANVDAVAAAGQHAGQNVAGWGDIQHTFNFKLTQAKDAAQAVAISFGSALLPAATAVMGVIASFAGWLSQNTWAAVTLAAVIGGTLSFVLGGKLVSSVAEAAKAFKMLGDSEMLQAAASKIAAAAQWLLNDSFLASPLGLIIAGIVAVVAAFVLLWTHSKAFRDFWIGLWHDIESIFDTVRHAIAEGFDFIWHAAETALNWVKQHWPLILGILLGPIATAAALIYMHWRQITAGAAAMFHDVVSFFTSLPGRILSALGNLGSMLWNAGVNAISGLLNGMGSMVSSAMSTVASWGHDIINALGSPFGIHFSEPSEAVQMIKAGRQIVRGLGTGMTAETGGLRAAAARVSGAALPGVPGGYGGGGGQGQLVFEFRGSRGGLDALFWTWIKNGVRAQGGDPAMFQRKVAFR